MSFCHLGTSNRHAKIRNILINTIAVYKTFMYNKLKQ